MILQLNPCLPVTTPKGPALAQFVIDNGLESDFLWVCFQDNSGECWTWRNRDVRAQKNITSGRDYISPFYNPDDVALGKKIGSGWIPVNKKQPLFYAPVIVLDKRLSVFMGRVEPVDDWKHEDGSNPFYPITHWMPFPLLKPEEL